MNATITRRYDQRQTTGELVITNRLGVVLFRSKTLELPWLGNQPQESCIPEGSYDVVPRISTKYGSHLHVTNVTNRSLILIHWGNYAGSKNPKTGQSDIKGCILVGTGYSDINKDGITDITGSKIAFKELILVAANGFKLEIK